MTHTVLVVVGVVVVVAAVVVIIVVISTTQNLFSSGTWTVVPVLAQPLLHDCLLLLSGSDHGRRVTGIGAA